MLLNIVETLKINLCVYKRIHSFLVAIIGHLGF